MSEVLELRRAYKAANKSYQEAWPRVLKAQAAVAEAQTAYLDLGVKMYQSESEEFCDAYDEARETYAHAVERLVRTEQVTARLLEVRDDFYRALAAAEKAA